MAIAVRPTSAWTSAAASISAYFYAELRYHYIWGPEVDVPVEAVNVSGDLKANGKFG